MSELTAKQALNKKVFDTADKRDLTFDEVKEAISPVGDLALCKSDNPDRVGSLWSITEVDVFFPDDDYVEVTDEVAKQIIVLDDVYHHILDSIDIYRYYSST